MERKICPLILLVFAACGPSAIPDTGADASVEDTDASVGLSDEEIMAHYHADVSAYQHDAGMSDVWTVWMLEKKDWLSKAYIHPRRNSHDVRVYVRYENPIIYTSAWSSEAEHFAALEYLAELQYPGWMFTFSPYYQGAEDDLQGNDAIAVLGCQGAYSYASGHTIYLVYETIFAHEFGHTLGLHHHYCGSGNNPGDHNCPENHPPGEGPCIMDRNSVSFGPTENSFLLLTTGERQDDKIQEASDNIHDRYPKNWFVNKPTWNDCGVEE